MRVIACLAALLLTACATPTEPDPNDPFVRAAQSWQGSSVDDMIAAWGEPNRLNRDARADREGTAEWGLFPPGTRERCIVSASFDTGRTVTSVRVREIPESRQGQCGRHFANRLEGWTHHP